MLNMHKRLGEILISHGIINNSQLENALDVQNVSKFNERLGQILISAGIISYTELAQALAEQFNINFIKLDRLIPAPEIIKLIPKNMAQRLEIIPVEIDDENFLHVAVIDPVDITVLPDVVRPVFSANLISFTFVPLTNSILSPLSP